MGFLERMMSDLVKDATGFNPRRAIRMIGGKNILMMGGAALAGTLAAKKIQGPPDTFGGGAAVPPLPSTPATTPSLPPIPGSQAQPPPPPGATPPLPPIPPATAAASDELATELTYPVVRTMVAAALADGKLDPREKEIIHRHLGESGLATEQVAQVHRDLVLPPSPGELASLATEPATGETMYRCALVIVRADQEVDPLELAWLDRLAAALELDAERRQQLDDQLLGDD